MSRHRLLIGYASGALAALIATGTLVLGWWQYEWTKPLEYFDMPPVSSGEPPIRVRRGADGKFYVVPASPGAEPKPDLPFHADYVFYNIGGMHIDGRTFVILLGVMSASLAAIAAFLLRRPRQ